MRLLLLITLMISMAVSPAAALGSCGLMADEGLMAVDASMADHGDVGVGAMTSHDCNDMGDRNSQPHDGGCLAACTLACPGFYAGPGLMAATAPASKFAKFVMPATAPGAATPSLLDPPPPRV